LHGQLGAYDPLKPLDRGEDLPSVEAYPRFDPYSKDEAFNAFAPSGPSSKKSKDKKKDKKKDKEKKEKKMIEADGANGKEKKDKKDKKSGGQKPKPEAVAADTANKAAVVDSLAESLMDTKVNTE